MGNNYYNKKTAKPKTKKEVPICGDCLKDPRDSDLKNWDFFWVQQNGYQSLSCVNCIKVYDYTVLKCYAKKPAYAIKADEKKEQKN